MTSFQKKLAAKVLKVGVSRVWMDPAKMKDAENAITRTDIRKLIGKGSIKALPEKLHIKKEKRRKKGIGSRKGRKFAIVPQKRRWIRVVRPLRRMLSELKDSQQIENTTYKKMRSLVKGGMFRSKHHLRIYLEQHDLIKKVNQ